MNTLRHFSQEELDLIKSLRSSNVERDAIQVLGTTLVQVAALIADDASPKSQQLRAVVQEMATTINAKVWSASGFEAVFTGKGHVARKLREHAMIAGWMNGQASSSSDALEHFKNYIAGVVRKIELFDYAPKKSYSLYNFVCSLKERVQAENFTAFLPAHKGSERDPRDIVPGIYSYYGEPGESEFEIMLRVKRKDGLEITVDAGLDDEHVFIAAYHPLEDEWILVPKQFSFDGIESLLEMQFLELLSETRHMSKLKQVRHRLLPKSLPEMVEEFTQKAERVFEKDVIESTKEQNEIIQSYPYYLKTFGNKVITVDEHPYRLQWFENKAGDKKPIVSLQYLFGSSNGPISTYSATAKFEDIDPEAQQRMMRKADEIFNNLEQASGILSTAVLGG